MRIDNVTGVLRIIERAAYQGTNGNPRYLCTIGERTVYSGVDSSLGYALPNYQGKPVRASLQLLRGKWTITAIEETTP